MSGASGLALVDSPNSFCCSRFAPRSMSLSRHSEFGLFPNRHLLLQFIHDQFARFKSRRAMLRPYPQKQRCFPRRHKSDSMMKQNLVQSKSLSRGVGDDFHLMLGHGFVSFIIDYFYFMTLFQLPTSSPTINHPP